MVSYNSDEATVLFGMGLHQTTEGYFELCWVLFELKMF